MNKISLTINERYILRHKLNLIQWGFTAIDDKNFIHQEKQVRAFKGDWSLVISCKRYTQAVEYDKTTAYFKNNGFKKIKVR